MLGIFRRRRTVVQPPVQQPEETNPLELASRAMKTFRGWDTSLELARRLGAEPRSAVHEAIRAMIAESPGLTMQILTDERFQEFLREEARHYPRRGSRELVAAEAAFLLTKALNLSRVTWTKPYVFGKVAELVHVLPVAYGDRWSTTETLDCGGFKCVTIRDPATLENVFQLYYVYDPGRVAGRNCWYDDEYGFYDCEDYEAYPPRDAWYELVAVKHVPSDTVLHIPVPRIFDSGAAARGLETLLGKLGVDFLDAFAVLDGYGSYWRSWAEFAENIEACKNVVADGAADGRELAYRCRTVARAVRALERAGRLGRSRTAEFPGYYKDWSAGGLYLSELEEILLGEAIALLTASMPERCRAWRAGAGEKTHLYLEREAAALRHWLHV